MGEEHVMCAMCRVRGVGRLGQGVFLRERNIDGKRMCVHENCALLSPMVRPDGRGGLKSVGSEIKRGLKLVCASSVRL
jgi:hypothetical protein